MADDQGMEAKGDERDPVTTTTHTWLSAAEEKVGDPPFLLLGPRGQRVTAETRRQRGSSRLET